MVLSINLDYDYLLQNVSEVDLLELLENLLCVLPTEPQE